MSVLIRRVVLNTSQWILCMQEALYIRVAMLINYILCRYIGIAVGGSALAIPIYIIIALFPGFPLHVHERKERRA